MFHLIGNAFNTVLVHPLINLLVLGYNVIPDIGVVIVLITILVRLALLPSMSKTIRSQKNMSELQPKLNEIRERHKDNKEAEARAMMQLYKDNKINPLSSCLPLLIQFPILIALYRVFIIGLGNKGVEQYLYSWVHNPGVINPLMFNWLNLAHSSWELGVVAGILQYFQSRMIMPKTKSTDSTTNALSAQTLYVLPLLTVFISLRLPAGLPLYWIITTLFSIAQQYYIMRNNNKPQVV